MKSVVLTRGTYRIEDSTELQIMTALDQGLTHVAISADVIGDGVRSETLRLFLPHVIAIIDDGDGTERVDDLFLEDFGKVRRVDFGR